MKGRIMNQTTPRGSEAPLYGLAYLGVALVTQVFMLWVTYFYAPPAGRLTAYLPIGLVGVALIIGRAVDALADPLVAVWSDNTRSARGRRLPFMIYGALPLAISFALIWFPPTPDRILWNFLYLTLVLASFLFFFTVVVAPYLALLPELAEGAASRVRYSAWQAFFNIVGLGIAMVGAGLIIERMGFRAMGVLLALVALVSFWIPAFGLREKGRAADQNPVGLLDSFRLTLANRPFRFHLFSQFLFWFGFNMIMIIVPYVITVIMGLSEGDVGLLLGGAMAVALVSFPVICRLARSWGTRKTFLLTALILAAVLACLAGIGLLPGIAVFWQGVAVVAASGFPLAGLFILPNAITAEITDHEYARTGLRREAIFYGMGGLVIKASMGFSSLATTGIMGWLGYTAAVPLGIRVSALVAALLVLAGFWAFLPFPLGQPEAKSSRA